MTRLGLRRVSIAFLAYVGSKSSVLVAPLLLSSLLPLEQYGQFELSLSVAQMVSVVLSLGIHGAVPYFLLKKGEVQYGPAFTLHVGLVVAATLVISRVFVLTGHLGAQLVVLLSGIAVVQFIAAARYQASGRPTQTSIAESFLYLLVLFFGCAAYAHLLPRSLPALAAMLTIYLALVMLWNLARFPWAANRRGLWRMYGNVARYGVTVLPATFANVGLVSLGRTLVGINGGLDQVAVYGLAYRLCAPIVAIHQFLSNFFFTRLYTAEVKEFEKYFVRLSMLLLVGAATIILLGPHVGAYLVGHDAALITGRTDLFLLIGIAMVTWAQLSLIELFMNREARLLIQLPGLFAGSAVTFLCVLIPPWHNASAADNVALFQGLGFVVAVLWQFHASGVPVPRWPAARAILLCEAALLSGSWLVTALGTGFH